MLFHISICELFSSDIVMDNTPLLKEKDALDIGKNRMKMCHNSKDIVFYICKKIVASGPGRLGVL